MTQPARDDRVLVAPRYLAGGGLSRLAWALHPLLHDFGWSVKRVHSAGRITLYSPHRALTVTFDPTQDEDRWWTIAHRSTDEEADSWEAVFGQHTPIEAVAATLQLLPLLTGDARHLERLGLLHEDSPGQLAAARGWTASASAKGERFTSPGLRCTLLYARGERDGCWFVETSAPKEAAAAWRAAFDAAVPEGLVRRFFANISGPMPAERLATEIPPALADMPGTRMLPSLPPRAAPLRTSPPTTSARPRAPSVRRLR
ncbi:DUF317 domain-containing protein [Streptomyces sp. NPDC087440]|uniref:DUF317 domain-containing protein n=1 Tax=Streptomyces sp. NPDC087440 TaxID=3365790 RepID=UPI00382D4ED9